MSGAPKSPAVASQRPPAQPEAPGREAPPAQHESPPAQPEPSPPGPEAGAVETAPAAAGAQTQDTPFGPEPSAPPEPLPRAQPGELVSAGCALLLLVLMFAVEWFGVDRLPGQANGLQRETAENAWNGLPLLRWLMLLTIFVAVSAVIIHATQRTHGARNDTGVVVMALGSITAILVIYRVLIILPSPDQVVDQKLGAILGMLAAIGVALGGYRSMYEERTRSRSEHPSKRRRTRVARRARPR